MMGVGSIQFKIDLIQKWPTHPATPIPQPSLTLSLLQSGSAPADHRQTPCTPTQSYSGIEDLPSIPITSLAILRVLGPARLSAPKDAST